MGRSSSHTINISGRNEFIGVEINNGHRNVESAPDLRELRRLLSEHRAELVRLGGSRGARVESRIEEIEEEIESGKPDNSLVRSAWNSVLNVLKGGATAAESVSKINDLIRSLFGA
jgi:hypothetical protein